MRGWSKNGRLGYDTAKVNKGIKVKVGGKAYGNSYAIVTMVQENAGASLFDIAGFHNGSAGNPDGPDRLGRSREEQQSTVFIQNLDSYYGRAQRGIWRKHKEIMQLANGELMKALEEVVAMEIGRAHV